MARKPRIDSAAEQVRIMNAAAKEIVPPVSVPLTAEELVFFNNVVAEFPKSELSAHRLELVAFLARTMAVLKCEQEALRDEGSVLAGENGSYANPRVIFVKNYMQSIISLRRSLSLQGQAREIPALQQRRQTAKAIERDSPLAGGAVVDLLARAN